MFQDFDEYGNRGSRKSEDGAFWRNSEQFLQLGEKRKGTAVD